VLFVQQPAYNGDKLCSFLSEMIVNKLLTLKK